MEERARVAGAAACDRDGCVRLGVTSKTNRLGADDKTAVGRERDGDTSSQQQHLTCIGVRARAAGFPATVSPPQDVDGRRDGEGAWRKGRFFAYLSHYPRTYTHPAPSAAAPGALQSLAATSRVLLVLDLRALWSVSAGQREGEMPAHPSHTIAAGGWVATVIIHDGWGFGPEALGHGEAVDALALFRRGWFCSSPALEWW